MLCMIHLNSLTQTFFSLAQEVDKENFSKIYISLFTNTEILTVNTVEKSYILSYHLILAKLAFWAFKKWHKHHILSGIMTAPQGVMKALCDSQNIAKKSPENVMHCWRDYFVYRESKCKMRENRKKASIFLLNTMVQTILILLENISPHFLDLNFQIF